MSEFWFEYPIRAHPHHTDYGGIVWHGTYLTWLEETRVEVLRHIDFPFEAMVAADLNLVVSDISLRYRQPLKLGMDAVVLARIQPRKGIRMIWEYELRSRDQQTLFMESTITLAAVSSSSGRLYRRLPQTMLDCYKSIQAALLESNVPLQDKG